MFARGLGIYFIQTAMDRVEYEIPPTAAPAEDDQTQNAAR
jgi:hypothetical protein